MTFKFGDEDGDTMDGFGTEESNTVDSSHVSEPEGPVPGYIPEEEQGGKSLESVDQYLQGPTPEVEEEYEAVMAQVDRRMKVAQYFRMVLDNSMFDDGTPEAKIAESRVRKYVREELEVLFGMRQVQSHRPAPAQFTDEEVQILKELIVRLKKPAVATPQFKPIGVSPRASVPSQPLIVAKTKPMVQVQAPKPAQPAGTTKPTVRQNVVDPRIPKQYQDDDTARVINGKVYIQARSEDGDLLWSKDKRTNKTQPIMKDVTPVARPTGTQPLPMPSIAQTNQIETQRAGEQLQIMERMAATNPGMRSVAGGLVYSLKQDGD